MSLDPLSFERAFRSAADGLGLSKLAEAVVEEESDTSTDDNDTVATVESGVTTNEESLADSPEEDEAVAIRAPAQVSLSASTVFQHPDTHPLILDLLLLRKYGPEWMEWEAETLELRIKSDFRTDVSDLNMHKIQACKTLHYVDTFWESWEVFVWVAMALNGIPPDFHIMQVPTVAQCMVAVDIANRIRQDVPFNQELNDYLEQVHMHDGIMVPIEPLTFVTMDDVDEYPVEIDEIKERWPEVRISGKAPPPTTVENEQLSRMLDLRSHLEDTRAALRAQLPLVVHV